MGHAAAAAAAQEHGSCHGHGHGHAAADHGHGHAAAAALTPMAHGHSHGSEPCHGHSQPSEDPCSSALERKIEQLLRAAIPDLHHLEIAEISGNCGAKVDLISVSDSFEGVKLLQ